MIKEDIKEKSIKAQEIENDNKSLEYKMDHPEFGDKEELYSELFKEKNKGENKVHIVDAIMGFGKTSAAIKMINDSSEDRHYIYITPFLTEVKRIKESCIKKKFFQPSRYNENGSKMNDLLTLIQKEKNIVTTHALFGEFNEDIIELTKLSNYVLIMDEVSEVVKPLNITKIDLATILEKFAYIEEGTQKLIWKKHSYNGKFNEYKDLAELGMVYVYSDTAFLWTFPVEIFKAFNEVFILTYKFKGQIQSYYYNYFKVKYDYIHIKENKEDQDINKRYQFENKLYTEEQIVKKGYKGLIKVYNGKLNIIGGDETDNSQYNLSKAWYRKDEEKNILSKKLSDSTYNYFRNIIKTKSSENMWTTFQDYKEKIKGKGFTKGFVACNARATNDYADKIGLAYLVNRYINPLIKNFFISNGIEINEDEYALSEMLQWIFRSKIRKGENVDIYVPSGRMRRLLEDWLEDTSNEGSK